MMIVDIVEKDRKNLIVVDTDVVDVIVVNAVEIEDRKKIVMDVEEEQDQKEQHAKQIDQRKLFIAIYTKIEGMYQCSKPQLVSYLSLL